jgi:glycine cleavage system H protein
VLELNAELDAAPENVNNDCYGNGWMIKSTITNEGEIADLLDSAAYKTLINA